MRLLNTTTLCVEEKNHPQLEYAILSHTVSLNREPSFLTQGPLVTPTSICSMRCQQSSHPLEIQADKIDSSGDKKKSRCGRSTLQRLSSTVAMPKSGPRADWPPHMAFNTCGLICVASKNVTPTDNALRKRGASAAENDGFRRACLLAPFGATKIIFRLIH